MEIFIQNRYGQKISLRVEGEKNLNGLVFILHGLWSNMDRPSTENMAKAFLDNSYCVVRFDARNSSGKSYGRPEDATISQFYEDLEDVIGWSTSQVWYKEPFTLAGSSLGGITVGLYAENNPEKVKSLFLLAPVVSGELSLLAKDNGLIEQWKETGRQEKVYNKATSEKKLLPWSHMEDRLKYNLLSKADKLTMPVLIMVGDKDTTCPLEQQQMLLEKLPGKKELKIIQGAEHGSRVPEHLQFMKNILSEWIGGLA
jgi:pimeloyl-ACP methyl ester carboxylesterase